jgi:hypothetical protein
MTISHKFLAKLIAASALVTIAASVQAAFTSGSTGADGALTPSVATVVTLPASGVLNYTTINIPTGVTVTFVKNTANTPVVLLVMGDAIIAGTINVSGIASRDSGSAGDGSVGDDGIPGAGGPGGYDGGRGGRTGGTDRNGGSGLGPGGGSFGAIDTSNDWLGGGGGGYAAKGSNANWVGIRGLSATLVYGQGGNAYGSSNLLPLVGGSGGGGGVSGTAFNGTGGGGGGGALLIAATTVNITGSILANGGSSGSSAGQGVGATGGGGAGGGIRIVAATITGNGTVSAVKGAFGSDTFNFSDLGGAGSDGRIRFEAETFTRTALSTPAHSFGAPGSVFITGSPTLRIKTVAGQTVPPNPTGVADVALPANVANPVAIAFETASVPVGNTVKVTMTPAYGLPTSAVSDALAGSTTLATASASLTLPQGASTLQATLTYTVTASLGDAMSKYALGERVEQVRLSAVLGGPSSSVTLITVSGREFEVPAALLAQAAEQT